MDSYESTLKINHKPVLPFSHISQTCQSQVLPIGAKVKSFRITSTNNRQIQSKESSKNVDLPSFISPKKSKEVNCYTSIYEKILRNHIEAVETSSTLIEETILDGNKLKKYISPSVKRFWWQWLLLVASVTLLLPNSSDARNILEKAKIYLNLNSSIATDIPESGKIHLQAIQASGFKAAIQQAQEVEINSPFFLEAQSDIIRWNQVILDIAYGRASQGDFAGAIAAAKLISQKEPVVKSIASQARIAIEQWELQAQYEGVNENLLEAAKSLIQINQASSYNRAIAILRQVSPGGEDYQEAQKLIGKWGRQIYLIANSRAAKGHFSQAIEAADLIPQDSPYYEKVTRSITKWQESLSGFRKNGKY
jgi:hypothetical protein